MSEMGMARILIVEDDRDLAQALTTLLRASGNDAHAIHDGRTALTEAARLEPEVVNSDIGLPSIEGAAVAHALRSRYGSALRLVALTASSDKRSVQRMRRAGFDPILIKPATLDDILGAICGSTPAALR
jgi:CheY-like chemotaxis protein